MTNANLAQTNANLAQINANLALINTNIAQDNLILLNEVATIFCISTKFDGIETILKG